MAVNLVPPDPASLHAVAGLELGVAKAGIRKPDRYDLLLMRLDAGATVFGYAPGGAGHSSAKDLLAAGVAQVFSDMAELPALLRAE